MSESVAAAIHIQGGTLQYAEIEHSGSTRHLRRVGHRTFDFDIMQALRGNADTVDGLASMTAAVTEGLSNTAASEIRVSVHPLDAFSFFAPVSAELSAHHRKRELIQQLSLVAGTRFARSLHFSFQTVRTAQDKEGEPFVWVHVFALPEAVEERVKTLVEKSPGSGHTWVVSSESAARIMGQVEDRGSREETHRPYSLAVGQYPSHTEYSLSRNREWYHTHSAPEVNRPENRAYYAVGFLNRIDVPLTSVGRLFLYGPTVDVEAYDFFEDLFDLEPEVLDPFRVVEKEPGTELEEQESSYVPCIGAGLDAVRESAVRH